MEAGLMRDCVTHELTTPEHWNMLMVPDVDTPAPTPANPYDLSFGVNTKYGRNLVDSISDGGLVEPDTVVTPSYDPHCAYGEVTSGCAPVAVISAEKLRDYTEGPAETAKVANVLLNDSRMGQYVIAEEAWDCIWEELIQNGKGLKTVYDRPGFNEMDYNFSVEMLEEMIIELDRLISKYSGPDWNTKDTANRVVALLDEHRVLITTELNEVNTGVRELTDKDFLGPKERQRRRALKLVENSENESDAVHEQKDHSRYFNALEKKLTEKKRSMMKQRAGK